MDTFFLISFLSIGQLIKPLIFFSVHILFAKFKQPVTYFVAFFFEH